jgi:hypothetical protein
MFSKNWCMNYKILIENQVFQQFFLYFYLLKVHVAKLIRESIMIPFQKKLFFIFL